MKICHVMVDFHCRPLHDRGRYGSARIAGAMIHRSMQARPIRAIHMQARPILATGALLAGGRGQRLGGDKVLAELAGRPLALWVLDALAPCVSEVLICIDRPERASELDGLDLSRATRAGKPRMVVDEPAGQGPLAALASALAAARTDAVFAAACDYPFLVPEAVEVLLAALERHEAALPEIAGRLHPLCGAYSRRILPKLRGALDAGQRKAVEFALTLDLIRVTESDLASRVSAPGLEQNRASGSNVAVRVCGPDPALIFTNINTREELARAEEHLGLPPPRRHRPSGKPRGHQEE